MEEKHKREVEQSLDRLRRAIDETGCKGLVMITVFTGCARRKGRMDIGLGIVGEFSREQLLQAGLRMPGEYARLLAQLGLLPGFGDKKAKWN